MPSATYGLIRDALAAKQSVTAMYGGHLREITPHVIGLAQDGTEQALFFQFGGGSASGLPLGGMWRCMAISQLSQVIVDPSLGWFVGTSQGVRPQSCVVIIDLSSGA